MLKSSDVSTKAPCNSSATSQSILMVACLNYHVFMFRENCVLRF